MEEILCSWDIYIWGLNNFPPGSSRLYNLTLPVRKYSYLNLPLLEEPCLRVPPYFCKCLITYQKGADGPIQRQKCRQKVFTGLSWEECTGKPGSEKVASDPTLTTGLWELLQSFSHILNTHGEWNDIIKFKVRIFVINPEILFHFILSETLLSVMDQLNIPLALSI